VDVDDDARTIGRRVRQIRHARGKSLRVVAGLAGISKSHLARIERGERSLDSRSQTVALANALQVAPSELISLPIPAPGNGDSDSTVLAVRQALTAVTRNRVSARNSATLRDLRIFVDHSAEPVTPNDLGLGYVGLGECS
jgi:transcriptional regulator with XRE-family HTH domain